MLTTICIKIIEAMGRSLHVNAYADARDNGTIKKGPKAGAGEDWMDVAPKTRKVARDFAFYLAGQIAQLNGKSLLFIVRDAMRADAEAFKKQHEGHQDGMWKGTYENLIANLDGETDYDDEYLRSFGHYIVMESLGHGVAWTDDHAEFGMVHPRIEFAY